VNRRSVRALPFERVRLGQPARHYRCPRDWSWRQHLDDHDLWLVLGGRGVLTVNGVRRPLNAPVATLLLPGDEVVGEHDPDSPLEVIALHFTPLRVARNGGSRKDWAARLALVPLRPVGRFRELGEQLAAESMMGDGVGAQTGPALALAVLGAVWRLAHGGPTEEGDDRVDELARKIQREPWQDWTVERMAREAGMGATRLTARMRELTGQPPAKWVIRCRLDHACILLNETDLKLASIADACGYRDVYFFARQFRQVFGKPPAAWREGKRTEGRR
jgi:AraC-type DNA-binding domain-containing proteins